MKGSAARDRIEGLDILRLFAALSVVIFHYSFRGAAADDLTRVSLPALVPITKYGYLGVDLFFVISGFVIAWSAEGRHWLQFAVARFARIYPAFVFCMTADLRGDDADRRAALRAPRFQQWVANLFIFSPHRRPALHGRRLLVDRLRARLLRLDGASDRDRILSAFHAAHPDRLARDLDAERAHARLRPRCRSSSSRTTAASSRPASSSICFAAATAAS